jgi:Tol biopolymer transport system component
VSLTPGTRIGVYEVIAAVGAGGMGEVFRARDTELDRDVALKILPASFANDADRLMRFEREAKTLATLNHPHIAQIYGIVNDNGVRALVMEFVEGDDLSLRVARGPVPLEDALAIARSIVDALEAAHDRGIIHRDLKPANIKVRDDGTVKVLDFGLAKALTTDAGNESHTLAHSPTITSPAMTQAGVILGTATYMSPEQARGKPVDRRADIWAFGCVLFEMLAGKRAFDGADVSDTIAAIIRAEPDWKALPDCPASVRRLLNRCLQKDPARRLKHIGDARFELEAADVDGPSRPRRTGMLLASSAGMIAGIAITAVTMMLTAPSRQAVDDPVAFTLPLPREMPLRRALGTGVAFSPDGSSLVYTARTNGTLVLRRLTSMEFVELPAAGINPFFSPDSKWIAFYAEGQLKKLDLAGGLAVSICPAPNVRGAWADDGSIIVGMAGSGLARVSAAGGELETLLEPVKGSDVTPPAPFVLPGSKVVLFQRAARDRTFIHALSLTDRKLREVVEGSNPRLVGEDVLVFEREGGLWAAEFDVNGIILKESPVAVQERVRGALGALYSTSASGALAFVPNGTAPATTLTWLDRKGDMRAINVAPAPFTEPQLSADGRQLAVTNTRESAAEVFVIDLERGTTRRLTNGGGRRARWSSDGRLAYQLPSTKIGIRRADGVGDVRVLTSPGAQFPDGWTPDGNTLVFNSGGASRDLWAVTGAAQPVRLLPASDFSERGGRVSPSGRLLAFVSNESGRDEVYVQPFPGPGPKSVISVKGGRQPIWSRDGKELFFRAGEQLMAVTLTENPLRIGIPVALFDMPTRLFGDDINRVEYDVAANGSFIAAKVDEDVTPDEIHVVLNWAQWFRRSRSTN